jgi:L-alanine-DL-glutamate epimerase-like enolase superfamily enzyme
VKLVAATVYALRIPFVEAFRHSAGERRWSDSVVVRVRDEAGTEGFGEGVARSYVTGETPETMVEHLVHDLWPEVAGRDVPELGDGGATLRAVDAFIPHKRRGGVIANHAARAALELGILDCMLRRRGWPFARLLPPRRSKVVYSGIVTAGSVDGTRQHARQMKVVGLKQVKVKVGMTDDVARVQAVREILGPEATLRLDANGAWTVDQATAALGELAAFDVAAVEQPLPRGPVAELRRLKAATSIPIMVDESLVTIDDAEALIAERAVDYFNIRVSKCGGFARSLEIAARAAAAGVRLQVGAQVGETAILSAAGRHLAASLPEVDFVEGSYGTLLLTEDVSLNGVRFGHRGEAPLLTGPGLGVEIVEDRLRHYAQAIHDLA